MAHDLDSLVQQLTATAESIRNNPASLEGHDKERSKLIESAQALLKLVKPDDSMMESMILMVQFTVIRLFVGWKVFESIPKIGSILYSDLAATVNADTSLIRRLASVLVSTEMLEQVGTERIAHTKASAKFAVESPLTGLVRFGFDHHFKILQVMPRYFEEYGRKEPSSKYHTISAFSDGDPTITAWEHINRNPERMAAFMASMVVMGSRLPMTGSYDFSWVVDKMDEDADRALVVDVGGGQGHALRAIAQVTPRLPLGRCVVEDLKEVVQEAKVTATGDMKEAQFVAMDFHSEQPVKGAFIYYIRRCLHDYGDKDCIDILEQISQAMAEDSRLLIVEEVLTNPPSPMAAAGDIIMTTLGGKERSLEGFTAITSAAGLKIAKVHPSPGSNVAVIECQKL